MIIEATIVCPFCGHKHIDRDEWAIRPHKTHLCTTEDGGCGKLFRLEDPNDSDVYFVGTDKSTKTKNEITNELLDKEFQELFWDKSFKKAGKGQALTAYKKTRRNDLKRPEERDRMLEAWIYVNEVLFPKKAEKDGSKQYIPLASTWLNGKRWEDEEIQEAFKSKLEKGYDINLVPNNNETLVHLMEKNFRALELIKSNAA